MGLHRARRLPLLAVLAALAGLFAVPLQAQAAPVITHRIRNATGGGWQNAGANFNAQAGDHVQVVYNVACGPVMALCDSGRGRMRSVRATVAYPEGLLWIPTAGCSVIEGATPAISCMKVDKFSSSYSLEINLRFVVKTVATHSVVLNPVMYQLSTAGEVATPARTWNVVAAEANLASAVKFGSRISEGGELNDTARAVAVTWADNSTLMTGSFEGAPTFGQGGDSESPLESRGGKDIYVSRHFNGGEHDWTVSAGGTGEDEGLAVAVTDSEVYVGGYYNGVVSFGTGGGAVNLSSLQGGQDAFVAKYDHAGNLLWVRQLASHGVDRVRALAVTGSDVYAAGDFTGADFKERQSLAAGVNTAGLADGFLVKLSATTGQQLWVKRFGAAQDDTVTSLAMTQQGATPYVNLGGSFRSSCNFAIANAANVVSQGESDGFILRVDTAGTARAVRRVGGAGTDEVTSLAALGTAGDLAVAGYFTGAASVATSSTASISVQAPAADNVDGFVLRLGAAGFAYWMEGIGGAGRDEARAVSVKRTRGNYILVAGTFEADAEFTSNLASASIHSHGGRDVFMASFYRSGEFMGVRTVGDTLDDDVWSAAATSTSWNPDNDGAVFAGTFQGSLRADNDGGIAPVGALQEAFMTTLHFEPDAP